MFVIINKFYRCCKILCVHLRNKQMWSRAEDSVLLKAVKRYGIFRWHKTAALLKRSPEECAKRFKILSSTPSEERCEQVFKLYRLFPAQYELISEQTCIAPELCHDLIYKHCVGREIICPAGSKNTEESFDIERQLNLEMANERLKKSCKKTRR